MTANLDHAVRLRRDRRLSDLYHSADLVLAHGFPLVLASLLRGPRLPERVTGADLIEPVCAAASRVGASVFVVGTRLSVLSKACTHLVRPFPRLAIVGAHSPSRGFEVGHPECEEVAGMIREAAPDIVFVALGSPKQELWAEVYRHRLPPSVYICAGAGFDYLAGQPRRAPGWSGSCASNGSGAWRGSPDGWPGAMLSTWSISRSSSPSISAGSARRPRSWACRRSPLDRRHVADWLPTTSESPS